MLVIAVAVASVAIAASLATPWAGSAAGSVGRSLSDTSVTWPGVEICPDMVILSVRGSSERPQPDEDGDPLNPTSYNVESAWGLGTPGELTAGEVQGAANGRGVTSVRQGVVYPALPVATALTDPDAYLASIKAGAEALVDAILARAQDSRCLGIPQFQIIGYSQGAWSVRIAMRWLAKNFSAPDSHGMPYIAGVVLLGDPTFNSLEPIVRWDPSRGAVDVGIAWAAGLLNRVPSWWYAPYSPMIRDRVSSYCLSNDLVCRIPHRWEDLLFRAIATKWANKVVDTHLAYGSEVSVRAGKWLSDFLPPSTRAARRVAGQVLVMGQGGDLDGLRAIWNEYTSPEELVADMNGQPGRLVHCFAYSARDHACRVLLDAAPGNRSLILHKSNGAYRVMYLGAES